MRELLEAMPGVASAEVSYEKDRALVHYKKEAIRPRDMTKMLEANGYKSWETQSEKKTGNR